MPLPRTRDEIAADLKKGLEAAGNSKVAGILRSDLATLAEDASKFALCLAEGWVDDGKGRVVHIDVASVLSLLNGTPAPAPSSPAATPPATTPPAATPAATPPVAKPAPASSPAADATAAPAQPTK